MSSEELKPCNEPQAHPSRCGCEPEVPVGYVSGERFHAEHERLRECRKERDAARAQLAAIQGGMGEAVGFDRNAAYAACPESGCDWGSFYVGWKAAAAQHQRITAAMAAEVERLSRMLNNATNDGIKLADERDALRAELERMDREAGETIGALVKQRDDARAELAAYKALSPYRIRRMKAVTKERDALAAELAAIKASVAALDRNAAFKACPDTGCDWSSFYRGWKAAIKAFRSEQQKGEK